MYWKYFVQPNSQPGPEKGGRRQLLQESVLFRGLAGKDCEVKFYGKSGDIFLTEGL